jgi:hypothetical protein
MVNFLRFKPSNRLRIPVQYLNADQCQDLKRGSYMIRVNQFVEVFCEDVESVPSSLTFDLSNSQKGDVIRLKDIVVPPKVQLAPSNSSDLVLSVIKSARSK